MRKYWAVFQTQLLNRLAYPVDLVAQSFSIVLFVWVFVFLWRATFNAAGQSVMSGLTLHQTVWYLMLAETILLSRPRLSRTVSEAVKDGSIAYLLNKPYNFLIYQFSAGLGDSIITMLFNLLAGGLVAWLSVGPPPPAWGWPLAIIAVIGAWLIDFTISAMIGLAAFLTEEVSAFEWIYSKVLFLLGGLLIPLDFFPTWLREMAQRLPFAYALYGPARLFVEPDLARFANLVAGQMLWLAVLGGLLVLFYARGTARLAINGG